jgi:uncharacterized membrane protein YesL
MSLKNFQSICWFDSIWKSVVICNADIIYIEVFLDSFFITVHYSLANKIYIRSAIIKNIFLYILIFHVPRDGTQLLVNSVQKALYTK